MVGVRVRGQDDGELQPERVESLADLASVLLVLTAVDEEGATVAHVDDGAVDTPEHGMDALGELD
jgi:hypothetical protein